jgi:hypothetical protein
VGTLRVSVTNPGARGKVKLKHSRGAITLDADAVRRLYYAVLGIEYTGGSLADMLENCHPCQRLSVDVPEDILRCERIAVLRKNVDRRIKDYADRL